MNGPGNAPPHCCTFADASFFLNEFAQITCYAALSGYDIFENLSWPIKDESEIVVLQSNSAFFAVLLKAGHQECTNLRKFKVQNGLQ